MYSCGGRYIVSTYDETRNAWIQSNARDYWQARESVTQERTQRALELLGYDRDDTDYYANREATGTLRERVNLYCNNHQVKG
jgi:hypothetical protein